MLLFIAEYTYFLRIFFTSSPIKFLASIFHVASMLLLNLLIHITLDVLNIFLAVTILNRQILLA